MATWLAVAKELNIVLYMPALVMAEVRAVYPDADAVLSRLLAHPSVIHAELTGAQAQEVARLLAQSGAWDGTAGHITLIARQRSWPVLTADPGRPQLNRPGPGPRAAVEERPRWVLCVDARGGGGGSLLAARPWGLSGGRSGVQGWGVPCAQWPAVWQACPRREERTTPVPTPSA